MSELDTLYKALDTTDTTHTYTLNNSRMRITSTPHTLRVSTETIHAVIFITAWTAGLLTLDYLTGDIWLSLILSGLVVCTGSLFWTLSNPTHFSATHAISLKPQTTTTLDFVIPPHIIAAYNSDNHRDSATSCIDTLYALHHDTLLNDREKHMLSQRCIETATAKINHRDMIRQETLSEYIDTWANRIDKL